MIYVFEGGSIVFDGSTISEEQKSQAVAIESLPIAKKVDGKIAIIKADKSTESVWYEYEDVPKTEEELQKEEINTIKKDMNDAIMELTMLISMGGM